MEYFDLHCDTLTEAFTQDCALMENSLQLSLKRGSYLRPWFQCFAVWLPDDIRGKDAERYFQRAAEKFQRELALHPQELLFCKTGEQLLQAREKGKIGALLTVEGGGILGGKLENIDAFYEQGVRMMTLTWNGPCELGDGVMVPNPSGLTDFGRRAVHRMEELGMVIDVSHASEPLFAEVAAITKRPFIATHSNSKKLCDHPRNLTDEQFCVIRDRGGLVGLNFYPTFLETSGKATMDSIVKHAEHFLALGGAHTLALGSDFDGAQLPEDMTGIESVERLYETFLRHNYKESTVNAIFFENAYEFFRSL